MPRPIPDWRTTREVEATRDMTNYKPRRTKILRAIARSHARQDADGAWRSAAPVLVTEPVKKLEDKPEEKTSENSRDPRDARGDVHRSPGDVVVR